MAKTKFFFGNHTSYLRPEKTHCNRAVSDRNTLREPCLTVKHVHVLSMVLLISTFRYRVNMDQIAWKATPLLVCPFQESTCHKNKRTLSIFSGELPLQIIRKIYLTFNTTI